MLELKSCCVLSVLHSVPEKRMLLLLIWMMMVSFQTGSSEDLLKPLKDEVMALEGETVTLSCKYSGSVYNVQWYQQKSIYTPQFIIADFSAKTEKFSVQHNKQNQEFHLQISSAAVTDSAVYYCAVRPADGIKMIFGSGTRLTVHTTNEVPPDFYYLENQNRAEDGVCLATSFTRYYALKDKEDYPEGFNKTKPTMITGSNGVYNQVAFLDKNGAKTCRALSTDEPSSPKPDPVVNLASLTIFGLRVIFFKTVVFNVLMTLRLWSSQ